MSDLITRLDVDIALANVTLTDGTQNGLIFDMRGRDLVTFHAFGSVVVDGVHELQVWEDDAPNMSSQARIPADRIIQAGSLTAGVAVLASIQAKLLKRYNRMRIVTTGASSGSINTTATMIAEALSPR